MSAPLDETIRSLVREVVRDEVRAALRQVPDRSERRNVATASDAGGGYVSLARAAAFADVAPGTLRRWIRSGRLRARRAGRVYRLSLADLEAMLAHGRRPDLIDPIATRAQEILRTAP